MGIKHSRPVPPFMRYCSAIIPTMFDDSLSYYEALCALNRFIQKNLVEVVNNNATVTEEYIKLVEELKEYVENYFENLDVQEEINNKLDAMAEAGTLQEIIGEYLNATAIWGFDNVADMKSSTNLIEGSYAKTLGYYSINDGGCATYKIRKVTNDDAVDESFLIEIGDPADELVAELVIEGNEVSLKQLGAKEFDGTKHDIKPYIEKYLNKITDNQFKLNIPAGVYHCSELNITTAGFAIYGKEAFTMNNYSTGTFITSYYDNQNYIIKIGNEDTPCTNWTLKGITFSSADFTIEDDVLTRGDNKTILTACLVLQKATYGISDNIFFNYIDGTALNISSSYENYFGVLNFRHVNALSSSVITFDTALPSTNISATTFDKIMGEAILGDFITAKSGSSMSNTIFGVINFEGWAYEPSDDYVFSTIDDQNTTWSDIDHHWSIFNLQASINCEVNNLQLNNIAYRELTYNTETYAYDTAVSINADGVSPNMIINNIEIDGAKIAFPLFEQNNHILEPSSHFFIDNVTLARIYHEVYLDVQGARNITCRTTNLNPYYKNRASLKPEGMGNVVPFADIQNLRDATASVPPKGLMYYDPEAQSPLHFAVKPYNQSSGDYNIRKATAILPITGTTLLIRAKVPNGVTSYMIYYRSDETSNSLQMVGTGQYEIYKYTLDANDVGQFVTLRQATGQVDVDIMLDWLSMS